MKILADILTLINLVEIKYKVASIPAAANVIPL
jgi:hypothetical protein